MEKYEFPREQMSFIEGMRQPFAVYQYIDNRVVTVALSDGFCRLFGYGDRAQAYYDMNHNMYKDTHPDDVSRIAGAAVDFATNGGRYDVIYRTRNTSGDGYSVIHATGEHVTTAEGVRLAHVWYTCEGDYKENGGTDFSRAINDEMRREKHSKDHLYDYLTGLPSMTHFFELAESGRKKMLNEGGLPALIYIDLSGMKYYNHKYSYAEGDKLLRSLAHLLCESFGQENCCHIGADHFAVLADENGLESKLSALFDEWKTINAEKHLPICAGIYQNSVEEVPISNEYDRAKLACDAIKGTYSSSFNYYRQGLHDDFLKRRYVLGNFDRALTEKHIQVYYQPIMRAITRKVCDDEALARWIDPVKGFMSPADFIPYLEDAGLIYKLDLYVLEQILEHIKIQESEGLFVVPHSINLSRSDFDSCDIVEEIKKRVDASGVGRDKICVEITESVIGSDFAFIKAQIERFQQLGFHVWIDDFGSGYSSLNVIQSVKFDLIKFDMNLIKKLDENESSKIILTELMKMATALGVDTICEGVETEEQARFLQEIGCSKLQGYYYKQPTPFNELMKWHKAHPSEGYENPDEAEYYESICGLNLFDLDILAQGAGDLIHNAYSTLPMGIFEIRGDSTRFLRSNQSYRDFFKHFFGMDISSLGPEFVKYDAAFMYNVVKTCCERGQRSFYDERMPDGSVIHSFARRISRNPISGNDAVAVAVLSITEPGSEASYVDIARALAADYYNIYIVDLDTERYIEYSSPVGGQEMAIERHGENFFEASKRAADRIYEEDREQFFAAFSKEQIIKALDEQGVFTATYRQIDTGAPVYVNMKITRMQSGGNRIIIGISTIDAQMKLKEQHETLKRERAALVRVMALSDGYLSLYTVEPETGHYVEYTCSDDFAKLGAPKEGDGFIRQLIENARHYLYAEDTPAFLERFSKENIERDIAQQGYFSINYRIMMNGKPVKVVMRIAPFTENNSVKMLVGVRMWRERRAADISVNETQSGTDISIKFANIVQTLAKNYIYLFCINVETEEFIEYHTDNMTGSLVEERRGSNFFDQCYNDARKFVHPEDRAAFLKAMDRKTLMDALKRDNTFMMTYRVTSYHMPGSSEAIYVSMNVSRMVNDESSIIMAVTDVNEQMKQQIAAERIAEERIAYSRINALTGDFLCVYVVSPDTDCYREFSSTSGFEAFELPKSGDNFFETSRETGRSVVHPDDLDRYLSLFTKEGVMSEIKRSGIFAMTYRLIINGKPTYVQLKAAMTDEKEGRNLIVGIIDINSHVHQEQEYEKRLAQAQNDANIDALTGVKNKHAYMEAEIRLDHQIAEHRQPEFAMVIIDINGLKNVNDSEGHNAGDQYILSACGVICGIFKHSPVFRVGGDEFALIVQGRDYARIDELIGKVAEHNAAAKKNGSVVIACGMAKYKNEASVAHVFEKADQSMYENKNALKSAK